MSALTIIEGPCAAEGSAHEEVLHSNLSRVWCHVPRGVEPVCRVFWGQSQPNKTSRSILHNLADNVGCSALAGLSTNHYDATIPMLIAQSPMNNTIETPTYNMASIMVFLFQLCERGALTFKKWPGFSRA